MLLTESKSFVLPVLPYEENALEPFISAKTLGFQPIQQPGMVLSST